MERIVLYTLNLIFQGSNHDPLTHLQQRLKKGTPGTEVTLLIVINTPCATVQDTKTSSQRYFSGIYTAEQLQQKQQPWQALMTDPFSAYFQQNHGMTTSLPNELPSIVSVMCPDRHLLLFGQSGRIVLVLKINWEV